MEKILITGAAGFIGSHFSEKLIKLNYEVLGIDCFYPLYDRKYKEKNLENLSSQRNFKFIEAKIQDLDLKEILKDIEYIFHLAAYPGVRGDWNVIFSQYIEENVIATYKILDAATKMKNLKKFIFASSSSVYGDTDVLPMKETNKICPFSPYGVSKATAEQLCYVFHKNFNVPIVSLRYFTVYGPRQRPDMAFHKFIKAILQDNEVIIYGDGNQTRDFTFIEDVISANFLVLKYGVPGEIYNIGGGTKISVNDVIKLLEEIIGKKAKVKYYPKEKGDVQKTLADITKAKYELNYSPTFKIKEGLKREYEWIKQLF